MQWIEVSNQRRAKAQVRIGDTHRFGVGLTDRDFPVCLALHVVNLQNHTAAI
jgi:hypothetical protein